VDGLLRNAERILETAVVAQDDGAQDCTICITHHGAIRILAEPAGWSLPALAADLGAVALFRVERRADLLGGISVVRGEDVDRKTFTAIPFYALANRGNSQQEVWVHQSGKRSTNEGWEGKLYREYQP